jgi:hypothetical protein
MERNYWGYRIDTREISYFYQELLAGRLRQGWGWDERQDLRNFQLDEGAGRNLPMFKNVKAGDILLVPQLPNWGMVSLVEATKDWSDGYSYNIGDLGDYGHIFPAKLLKSFTRANENVSGNIRSTLKNPSRFWNINHYSNDIEAILSMNQGDLEKEIDYASRLESTVNAIFNNILKENAFADKLFDQVIRQFSREEWEFALAYGLQKLFPMYVVNRVGGIDEPKHGTDIEIRIPGVIPDMEYIIAIQVKDYVGPVGRDVIDQINRAESYYNDEKTKLIEKVVLITKSEKDINKELIEYDSTVKFIFANDLKILLTNIAMSIVFRQ